MNSMTQQHQRQQGFTLVELSIVLVIIGLIIGGVLVGQDMIKAAEIRATIGQIEKYDTAANTFRDKYNGYPGDLSTSANFTLASTGTGTANHGDGDGLIEAGACTTTTGFGGENALFWTHLNQANLIDGSTTAMTDYTAVAAIAGIGDTHMPAAKLGKANRFHIFTTGGLNYYLLSNMSATTITTCALTVADAITPQEAFRIDSKMDDGAPTTGLILSVAGGAPTVAGGGGNPLAAGTCYDTAAATIYGTSAAVSVDANGCQLRVRTSF